MTFISALLNYGCSLISGAWCCCQCWSSISVWVRSDRPHHRIRSIYFSPGPTVCLLSTVGLGRLSTDPFWIGSKIQRRPLHESDMGLFLSAVPKQPNSKLSIWQHMSFDQRVFCASRVCARWITQCFDWKTAVSLKPSEFSVWTLCIKNKERKWGAELFWCL